MLIVSVVALIMSFLNRHSAEVAPGILVLAHQATPVLLLVVAVVLIGIVVWEDHKDGYCGVSSRHVPILGIGVCMKTSTYDPSLL